MAEQRERRRSKKSREEQPTEWQERVIQIRRVTKVVKGGKKLSFRAVVVVGNERGQVGVGVGKANDVIGAVRKGVVDGKKHLIEVPLTKGLSVPHPMQGAGGGATVLVMPAAPGTGVIAGGGQSAPFWSWRVYATAWPSNWDPATPSTMPVLPSMRCGGCVPLSRWPKTETSMCAAYWASDGQVILSK